MALTWNIADVKDRETKCYQTGSDGESYLHPITNGLIYLTLSVGIGTISEKTIPEFYARVKILERLDGPSFRDAQGKGVPLTLTHLTDHINLRTNVHGIESRAKWCQRIVRHDLDRYVRDATKFLAEQEA